jgi:hypothetical protein
VVAGDAVIEPRRTAKTLRGNALAGAAAVAFTMIAWLSSTDVRIGDKSFRAVHLGVSTPAWLFAAWLLVELRRRAADAPRALLVAAVCATVAAAAAIGAELCIDVVAGAAVLPSLDWVGLVSAVGLLGAVGWMIATCRGLAAMSRRLARRTLHLPHVRLRERALHLGTAFAVIPWSLLAGLIVALGDHPVIGLGVAAAGVLALVTAQLALADLVARSRELPTAATRGSVA